MPSAVISPSLEEQALTLISPIKFHQIFTIPATESHGPLKITYSIIGPQHGDVPTILFIGGMFGSRWMGIPLNSVAEKQAVRILFIDRPGFGGSTPVPVTLRIPVFLETVPLLLEKLKISHLAMLASHSSGTIYALNTLFHLPHLLSPTTPHVTLFAPWVYQSISRVSMLQAAALLPDPLLNHWNGLIGFIVNKALPNPAVTSTIGAFGASSGVLSAVGNLWSGEKVSREEKKIKKEEEEERCVELCGYGLEMKKLLGEKSVQCAFAENTQGGNDEARLCLKSVEGVEWDAYESLPVLVAHTKQIWTEKVSEGGKGLKMKLVFGESDVMIGRKGREYFEESWVKGEFGGAVEVEVVVVEGADHDSVVDSLMGAVGAYD